MIGRNVIPGFAAAALTGASGGLAADPAVFRVDPAAGEILESHCYSCHEEGTEKGDIRLDNLGELSLEARLDLMNRIQEQVYLKQMPPPKKKRQPSDEERKKLGAWLWQELHTHNASKLEEKLRYPAYGNHVDHDTLFGGKIDEAACTPARRWLVSPQIFDQRVRDVFGLEGKDRNMPLTGVTNPFVLPDTAGVRDYDIGLLDGGSLLVMLANAEWISRKQIRPAQVKNGEIDAKEFPDPKDRWSPRQTPAEFEAVILKKASPSDEELQSAIRRQFESVLRRPPSESEASRYLELTRSAIGLAGNTEGLRQMLVAVLLESEFLYRQEWGAGEPDAHGRRMLAPHEAAYAISYAMGDRGPDAKLLEAAAQGKLNTREDFKREVTRLLDDTTYYHGGIDAAANTGKVTSHAVSHPRVIRFFREFFGYPNAPKIFKDKERSHGIYQSADRGTLGTAGFLVDEADKVVAWCVEKDQAVFENLLTTDRFFVFHSVDNATAAGTIGKWRQVWEALKDSEWKADPEKVVIEHAEMLKAVLQIVPGQEERPGVHTNTLTRCMTHFEATFGRGVTPFVKLPWWHGNTLWHTPMYNLPAPTGMGWHYDDRPPLDYPTEQPFKLENRKGILTHPAWLIAHSQNTATDPVKRGRWVREKLLAGRVPDIPITVDAVVPEDHAQTLRARLEKVTTAQECWKCHESMNPLGLPFEMYDDFGRFRTAEPLEHPENVTGKDGNWPLYKTLPVDARGLLDGTGDPALDGEVTDAIDLIGRLAQSTRVRQSIIRHAFRFYMGRNEMLSDSKTLIDADKAYVGSGGSFRAVIVSLLTSDSFIYRK
jgi:Protein of unknown function (DUF1588)/Protein of unknown function (DUF1592)/Protein of unknown function (DUF1585)/Protein of unknown function (DUF1595)/Planctomycete cytochrome C